MQDEIHHDRESARFHWDLENGDRAHLDYRMRDATTMDTTYTYTPPSERGNGVAGRLVRAALDHAREEGWRVIPSCWYVGVWIQRNPEYEDLLA